MKEEFAATKQNKNQTGSFTSASPNNQTSLNPPKDQKPSGLINTLGTLLPFAPLLYEQFTGQKVPALTGTLAEINSAVATMQLSLSQILNNQQQLWTKLEQLEKGANHQFTQLGNQFQSLRLTHTKERKEIEYNPNSRESKPLHERNEEY